MDAMTRTTFSLLVLVLTSVFSSAQKPSQALPKDVHFNQTPLVFEENHGQTDPRVQFLSRGKGYTTFLTAGGVVLSLRPMEVVNPHAISRKMSPKRGASASIEFSLVGAGANPIAVGEAPLPGRVNYFIGSNPSKWRTNIQTYQRVRYKGVYPGIDLIYYGNHRQLEYDFAVSPKANPDNIQFQIKGARQVTINSVGNLVVSLPEGDLQFHRPTVYQDNNGVRVPLAGGYVLKSSTRVGFHVPNYDTQKPLIIDPVLAYSTYLGGSGDDQPTGIAVDASGSIYVTGYTDSTDFPTASLGSLPPGTDHVFVAKFDSTGTNLVYADYLGGSTQDYGFAIAVDSSNEVYLAGSTVSSDFPIVNGYQPTYPGSFNAFVTKISADGSSLLYSTYLGGNGSDTPATIAVDNLSNFVVAGTTSSTNFPVSNAFQPTVSPNGGGNYGNYGFATKFSADGSSLVYSTYLGGNSNVAYDCGGTPCWPQPATNIAGLALDASGNAYVAGSTNTYNFPVSEGAYLATNTTPLNGSVGFVTKFASSGNLQYSTYFYETSGFTNINAIAVDGTGSAYVTGLSYSDGTFPLTSTSICDPAISGVDCSYAFVTKFDATGSTLSYSTFLGANNYAAPSAIALDQNDNAYVLASTSDSSFSAVNGLEPYAGGNDILLVEIDPLASTQLFATYLGGSADEYTTGMAIDASGKNVYLTGTTSSTDLPTTTQAFQMQAGGNTDGFVMKVSTASAPVASLSGTSIEFSSVQIGTTSAAQQLTLRNTGDSALTISSISVGGDYAETDNCGTSLAASASCTLSVTFTPTALGQRTGSLVIIDDAVDSPQSVSLDGTGIGASVSLSANSLNFSSTPVQSSSAAQSLTITNQGNSSLTINNIQVSGDFSQTNNCAGTLAANASCTVNVVFSPVASGSRAGTLSVSDSAAGSPQTVALSGTGTDFSFTTSSSSASIKAGATASFSVTLRPVSGTFSSAVQLSCSGAPSGSTCSVSPSSVTPGSNPASITVTIATKANSADASPVLPRNSSSLYAVWLQLPGFGVMGAVLLGGTRRKKNVVMLILLVLLIGGVMFMSGCAGGTGIVSGGGTTPGTYPITLTGTSGNLQHSLPLVLTVQ